MAEGKTGSLTLRSTLSYKPVELSFGTSGLRGAVRDITNLEAFVAAKAFLRYLLDSRGIKKGDTVFTAGDLRPSTDGLVAEEGGRGEILQAVIRGIEASGLSAGYMGKIPSPALMCFALRRNAPSIMVTGSHIPFDRNGIKFNKPDGEVLKSDESPILSAMQEYRAEEYERPARESFFDPRGMLKPERRASLPAPRAEAREEYVRRYVSAFPRAALKGARILVWQHSAVGRDILVEILRDLGAEPVPAGKSDTFVPLDTEAVDADMLALIQGLADSHGPALQAVVSTDGDGDRPLVLGVDGGRVHFFPGDLLGLVTAQYVGAREIAVPISVNDAVDLYFSGKGVTVRKTRIGSPHVIAAMKEAGWEANGGFLTAAPVSLPGGGVLDPLPTRDAMLPILAALCASLGRGLSLSALFGRLPPRFGRSALLRDFPREMARALVARLTPRGEAVEEARFDGELVMAKPSGGGSLSVSRADALGRELFEIRERIHFYFPAKDGFSPVGWINWLDGVRIGFDNGEVAHVRPSGNAPELRLYANADTRGRAEAIAAFGSAEGGALRAMERDVTREAIDRFIARPRALRLRGAVKHYPWGGYSLIPSLIGEESSGGEPYAELWIGAHPNSPSMAEIPVAAGETLRVPLDELVAAGAGAILGDTAGLLFGGRLPYLLKVLDARVMLSVQAHPSKAQAAAGFARENAAGIPLAAPTRSYVDDNHKPEVHVALTDFWMLHGFRPLEEIARIIGEAGDKRSSPNREDDGTRGEGPNPRAVKGKSGRGKTGAAPVPELSGLAPGFGRRLKKAGEDPEARRELLKNLYRRIMTFDQEEVDSFLGPLVRRLEREKGSDKDSPDYWARRAARDSRSGSSFDRGIFSVYLLNLLHLRPGQGTFQPAGTLHAYLEGANVELMANSDNVLRGGLTSKHVDVAELLEILTFEDGEPRILEGRAASDTLVEYPAPAEEFLLARIKPTAGRPHRAPAAHGPDCLIVMEGEAAVESGGETLELERGGIALVPAGLPYTVAARTESAVLFGAGIPTEPEK